MEHRKGNLFNAEDGVVLAHGCNTFGVMGAGIAMPKNGCGIGGFDWEDVEVILTELEKTTPARFIVYEL